ncbi:hypothetical protein FHP29_14155 [Nocardioides albidus]|uniref:Uncharacterized protein n=1 Tax=Nocardioides albidus TaxID=1517589 RepID=A0A5C4VR72_9ACTN|nr:hypothetical protein [Nocardioides albidus]TNM38402.1 hypothetical protein FHP29_14155 [Nocardioides albidus]
MRPLHWIALGLAVAVFTTAPDDRVDVAEVLGSLLVLVGWIRLSKAVPDLPLRLTLGYLAVLTVVVAAALSAPAARAWLDDADPAVVWASSVPALGFQAALCHAMGTRARGARVRSGWWWFVAEAAILVALVASVLYDGAGWRWLYGVGTVGLVGVLLVILLGALQGSAPWAGAPEDART